MFKGASEFLQSRIGEHVTDSPSPFMSWLKPVMLRVSEGSLAFQYTIRHEMTNPFGTLHGGVTAAIIDDAIGATLIAYEEPYIHMSINLVVDYLSAAYEGDVIIAETAINKKGSQLINAQCEVWNADHTRLIAKGYSNLIKTEKKS